MTSENVFYDYFGHFLCGNFGDFFFCHFRDCFDYERKRKRIK